LKKETGVVETALEALNKADSGLLEKAKRESKVQRFFKGIPRLVLFAKRIK